MKQYTLAVVSVAVKQSGGENRGTYLIPVSRGLKHFQDSVAASGAFYGDDVGIHRFYRPDDIVEPAVTHVCVYLRFRKGRTYRMLEAPNRPFFVLTGLSIYDTLSRYNI